MSGSRLEVVYVEASALRPNGWNPNEMDAGMLDRLRREVERVGFVQPVVAMPDGRIIDGEHRWEVARERGWRVPVVYLDVDEATAKTLCLNLNSIRGENDPGRLLALLETMPGVDMERVLGITSGDMDRLSAALESPRIREFDEDIETRHECPRCRYRWS
jgi:hypothetical protein